MKRKNEIANNATIDFKDINANGENVISSNLDSMYFSLFEND
jgi:hypothetical protein